MPGRRARIALLGRRGHSLATRSRVTPLSGALGIAVIRGAADGDAATDASTDGWVLAVAAAAGVPVAVTAVGVAAAPEHAATATGGNQRRDDGRAWRAQDQTG